MIFQEINSFKNVNITPNSLVICDIDDTVLKYDFIHKEWWEYNNLSDWVSKVYTQTPKHTDESGFFEMIDKINNSNSKLIFITARNSNLKNITHLHLESINININNHDVYFSHPYSKGIYLKRLIMNNHIDLDAYDRIVFIDDLEENLNSMSKHFKEKIHYYKFSLF